MQASLSAYPFLINTNVPQMALISAEKYKPSA